jgi:16S rRNA (uracil1498-N3)-methyltransferase
MTLRPDPRLKRLFVGADLAPGAEVEVDRAQHNYLANVLRLREDDPLLLFNGRDGEWRAALASRGRKSFVLRVGDRTREQTPAPGLHYLFAPLKQARLDYVVEKATEMGAGRLRPLLTQHGQVTRINRERMLANAIEAAEQCGLLSVPEIDDPAGLDAVLRVWPAQEGNRRIVFCDEAAESASPLSTLAALPRSPLAVLIGPEGGFSAGERDLLRAQNFVTAISLGPRIMRADTAAVAALAVVQASLGDWR